MGSIINKANILKMVELVIWPIDDFTQANRLLTKEATMSNLDYPTSFISRLGEKGKYALLILIVLLATQGKAQNINAPNKTGPLGTEVNTSTGNLFLSRNDIFIPTRGVKLDISFYYNTFTFNQNKGFGNGWSFNFGMYYKIEPSGITIVQGDGREDFYTLSGNDFVSENGKFDKLSQYQTGKYLLQTKFGMKYYFDNASNRRVNKIQDRNGNFLNLNYQDSLITSLVNEAGQTITFTYSAGRLATVVDAIASPTHTYSYTYDGYGNLIQVLDPLGNKSTYQYLVNGPMSGTTDKNGNTADIIYYPNYTVSELISCNGRKSFSYDTVLQTTVVTDYVPTATNQVTTYKYNTSFAGKTKRRWLTHVTGNCCGNNMIFNYDNSGNLVSRIDANGNTYAYTYDNFGNMLTITDPLGNKSSYTYSEYNQVKSFTDANGNTYSINYDDAGNPTQMNKPGSLQATATYSAAGDMLTSTDWKGNTYQYSYDAYGYPTQLLQPLNSTIKLAFDARGNLLSGTDPNGNITNMQYDLLNRLTVIKDPFNNLASATYDGNGNISTLKDPNGHISKLSYDASNRVVAAIDANGGIRQYAYDAMDNLIQFTDELGKITKFGYDNQNRMTTITDALGNGYAIGYDNNGNMVSLALPNGANAHYVYDKMDRPISGNDDLGSLGTVAYDNNGNIISYTNGTGSTVSATYDMLNRVTSITDPLGNARTFTYDKNNNPIATTDRNGRISSFSYDALDRTTESVDNNGNSTKFGYDASGNLLSATDANNHATNYSYDALQRLKVTTYPDGSSIHFNYDNLRNVTSKQLTDGSTISYQHDAINRMVSKTLPGNNTFTFNYDAKGRITSATNSAGTVLLVYDDVDRLVSEGYNAHTTSSSYNIAARTKTITYPDGNSIIWNFDARNRLSSINKGLTSIAKYQYNNANQLQQLTYANGTVTNWQYDQANRLTNLSTQANNLPTLAFTYDKEWNKTTVARSNFPQAAEQLNYDAAYRLTGFKQGVSQSSYNYDNLGNRTAANIQGASNTYVSNNLNQYTSVNNGSQTVNFNYDGNGNLTYDGNFGKRYDAEGRLLVDSNSNNRIQYQYDAFGRRIQKSVNGKATSYYYSVLAQIEQRDVLTDTVLNETVFNGSFTPIMVNTKQNNYYYHQNDLNSVEAISNNNGTLVERYQYDSYGATSIYDSLGNILTASLLGNRFAFTGQEYDAETRNYHFHFRTYNPSLGSFNQRDPIGYGDGMGMYQYVHNNPGNAVDLLGLDGDPCYHDPNKIKFINENEIKRTKQFMIDYQQTFPNYDYSSNLEAIGSADSRYYNTLNNEQYGNNQYYFKGQELHNYEVNYYFTGYASGYRGFGSTFSQGTTRLWNGLKGAAEAYNGDGFGRLASAFNPVDTRATLAHTGNLDARSELGQNELGVLRDAATGGSLLDVLNLAAGHRTPDANPFGSRFDNKTTEFGEWWPVIDPKTHEMGYEFFSYKNIPKSRLEAYQEYIKDNCPQNKPHGNQTPDPPGPQNPGNPFSTNNINSLDPNEIIGPTGVGTPQFVSAVDQMPYTINFENSINASAPAKTVRVNYPVDAKQDLSNISLGSFGFNSLTFNVPPNTPAFYQRLDARDSLGLYVDVTAGLDVANRQIFWIFQSIDPITLLTPADPLKGFLLLNDTSKPTSGHGFVNFYTKPANGVVTGDTVHAAATIVFDGNDTIPTNVAKNTIDAVAPTSRMNGLPSNSASTKIPLSWTAVDDNKGSGVKSYSLYFAINGGAFALYATNIARKDTTFTGITGNSYSFFVLGTDSVGNTETLKPGAEATTYINAVVLPVTWLYFNAVKSDKDGLLTWATATETNTKSFDVERSIDGRNFTTIGSMAAAGNSTVQSNYTYTDINVVSLNAPVVYYRLKQIDKDGKATYSNIVALQLPVINVGPIVQAYPNPFKETLNVMIANMTALDMSDNISIYTLEGKIVYQKSIGQRMLNTTITLTDLPQLTPGMYILKLGLNKQSYSFKLMKQ